MIDAALASTAGLIEAGHFTVECDIEPDLPEREGTPPRFRSAFRT